MKESKGYVIGDSIGGSSIIYKKDGIRLIKGLLLHGDEQKWFDVCCFYDFHCNIAIIDNGSKIGYIDRQGKYIIPPEYDAGEDFAEGKAFAIKDGENVLLNSEGIIINVLSGDYITGRYNDGLCRISKMIERNIKLDGFVNESGNIVIPPVYSIEIEDCNWLIDPDDYYSDDLIRIKKHGKYGFININQELEIPFIWEYASCFNDNIALVKLDNKYGYIDKNMNMIISPNYTAAYKFINGFACVRKEDKWGIIDKEENTIVSFDYEYLRMINRNEIICGEKKKFGLLNFKDMTIIPPEYDQILKSTGGIIEFIQGGRFGVRDNRGNKLLSDTLFCSELNLLN